MLTINDVSFDNKKVIIREDFNVPLHNGTIVNTTRIDKALPTVKSVLKKNAAVILISHLGRPTEGKFDPKLSLQPVADYLSEQLQQPVTLIKDFDQGVSIAPGQVVLLENIRLKIGEAANDDYLAKRLADLGDVFIMDAFGCAHRAQASTVGITRFIKSAVAGPLLIQELEAINKAINTAQPPIVAVVGGAKISSKLTVLKQLIKKVDCLIVGGGIANTLLAAHGINIGNSLYEADLLDEARDLIAFAKANNVRLPLPVDVATAQGLQASHIALAKTQSINDLKNTDCIFDIGPQTINLYQQHIAEANTILWNGPVGVFEYEAFAKGSVAIAKAIANNTQAYSIAGGGETLTAIANTGLSDAFSYLSTGGGAFLEVIEGKTLPAVAALSL